MDVSIREAGASDAPTLEIVRRQAIEGTLEGMSDPHVVAAIVNSPEASPSAAIDSTDHLVLLAETPITPVAYAVYDRNDASISGLFTSPSYRGEGFATALLDRIVAAARSAGESTLEVTTPTATADFFLERGFEVVGPLEFHGIPGRHLRRSL